MSKERFTPKLIERYYQYINSLFRSQLITTLNNQNRLLESPKAGDIAIEKVLGYFDSNNLMSHILADNEFMKIEKREKELKGNCKLGTVFCIDGRISALHQFGRTVNSWEIAGSLMPFEEKDGRKYLTSRRLIGAMKDTASEKEGRELLEIVTAHTSTHDKKHRCGRITLGVNRGEFEGDVDEVALTEAEYRREAFENTYNGILINQGKKPQDQVAITAMVDTDTMGFILNFGQDNELSTTNVLMKDGLVEIIDGAIGQEVGKFGSMRDLFTNPKSFIEYSNRVEKITRYLMTKEIDNSSSGLSFIREVQTYIDTYYEKLTPSQKQALLFTFCRTIANQYVTGLAGDEEIHHPYLHHNEDYIVISPNGKPFGRYDINRQSFASTPQNREEMLTHTKIKLSILDGNRKKDDRGPDVILISTPINERIANQASGTTFHAAEDAAIAYYNRLINDAEVADRIKTGRLIIVPIIIDEDSGKMLGVRDYSDYVLPNK